MLALVLCSHDGNGNVEIGQPGETNASGAVRRNLTE